MRVLSFLLSALTLGGGALAAKKASSSAKVDTFESFHSKAVKSASAVKLNDASYKKLTPATRDYAAAILLTAMDQRYNCQLCREFQPEWDLLSKSWIKGDKNAEARVAFGTLDFTDGRDTFMGLGLQTAPVLIFFPPTVGPNAVDSPEPLRYDFASGPQTAEQVHSWITRHLPDVPHPPVKRPINWMRWIVGTIITLGTVTAAFVAWPYLLPVIQNRNVWAAISLVGILLFTSGIMFNQIRKVPYVAGDGKGGVVYFAGGFQSQYGLETQIVAAMYGVLSFAIIGLVLRAPRIVDADKQRIAILGLSGIVFVMYSFLLSVFRIKNGGYPFSLPPFM